VESNTVLTAAIPHWQIGEVQEINDAIESTLAELPARDRLIFMFKLDGRIASAIAELLGVDESHADRVIRAGWKKIAAKLADHVKTLEFNAPRRPNRSPAARPATIDASAVS
jgi:DNA-directed RNA polymerase specialized sigma24 family protein